MTDLNLIKKAAASFLIAVCTAVSALGGLPAKAAGDSASSGGAAGGSESTASVTTKKKKSTEMSFDDVLVQGKYHFSDEAVTTVEDDKILDALLGVRTDFKDRIKKSTARH